VITQMGEQVWADAQAGAAVLGLGGCLDYEITWDVAALEELVVRHGITADLIERGDVIRTEPQLVASILAFLRDGVGGERPVASLEVLEAVARAFPRRVTLGGTSVRAAIAMSRIGIPSTLHLVAVDDQVRALLPPDVAWISSGEDGTLGPHLIVQFPRGARVRVGDQVIEAPASNRLIYVCDQPNTDMVLDPRLGTLLEGSRLFLISGFNAMVDESALRERIASLRDAIARMPDDALVVFEDAGYHVPAFSRIFVEGLADLIDVYGMNEDELQAWVGRSVDLLDEHDVALGPTPTCARSFPDRRCWCTRARGPSTYGDAAARFAPALDSGIALAGTRYLHGVRPRRRPLRGDDALTSPGRRGGLRAAPRRRWLGERVACRGARVLDTATPTTIGLGDTFVGGVVAALVHPAHAEGMHP